METEGPCVADDGEDGSLRDIVTLLKDYQQNVFNLFHEYNKLRHLLNETRQELSACLEEQKRCHLKIIMLQESLESFQDLDIQKLSMFEENSQLKKEIDDLMEKHFIAEEINCKKIKDLESSLQQAQEKYALEVKQIEESYDVKVDEFTKKFQDELEDKSELLRLSEMDIVQLKNNFQAEFSKYKSEMEDKLVKLQPTSNSSLLENQDIFRKKLLYEKQEANKEKSILKKRILELEQIVNTFQSNKAIPPTKIPRK